MKIREFNPDSKIIATLRNPVEMVYALHSEFLDWSIETVADFETAWRIQDRRSQDIDLPRGILAPLLLQYQENGPRRDSGAASSLHVPTRTREADFVR
jgi:hypothetical protein